MLIYWPSSAHADVFYYYDFSGDNGLSGNFVLDASAGLFSAPSTIFPPGTNYSLVSPFNTLAGSFGSYSFTGNPSLFIFDSMYNDDFCRASMWYIATSSLSSNVVNGLSVTGVNLFIDSAAGARGYDSLVPPPPPMPNTNFGEFSYSIIFSDGTFTAGQLDTLRLDHIALVPEPSTLMMLAIGLLTIPYCAAFESRVLELGVCLA